MRSSCGWGDALVRERGIARTTRRRPVVCIILVEFVRSQVMRITSSLRYADLI